MRGSALLIGVLAAAAAGCRSPASESPSCAAAAPHPDGWCEECGAGYVASIWIPSRQLFEVIDAHGHDVDPDALSCPTCKLAWRDGGYCNTCRMGFVRGQAYLSRLAYHVARAEVQDPARIECPTCAANARDGGWCERCGMGRIGALVLHDRGDLEETRKAIRKLRRALEALDRCQTCGVAAFADGRCRVCDLTYRDGEPLPRR